MKPVERIIMLGMLRDLDYWQDPKRYDELVDMPMGYSRSYERRERGRCLQSWKDANEGDGLIRIDLAKWFGPGQTDSQRVMAGRAMKRLELDGLITRHALEGFNERLTHARFTDEGLNVARKLQVTTEAREALARIR